MPKPIAQDLASNGRQELVVYLLGAGFSAPLGLPVMANFISTAKDQYMANSKEFSYFQEVFDQFDRLAKVVKYFSSNQFNIEEILSILDMEDYIGANSEVDFRDLFTRFLCDVIEHHTPNPKGGRELSSSNLHQWAHYILEDEGPLNAYSHFVANLFNLVIKQSKEMTHTVFQTEINREPQRRYSVVTLNYDEVLERACSNLGKHFSAGRLEFRKGEGEKNDGYFLPYLSKLHGTVSSKTVVPPTWSKGRIPPEVETAWNIAGSLLAKASHIRVIGYSLPESDSYIRYLLKVSSLHWYNLKSFDVLCLDGAGDVEKRYRDLVKFPLRFRSLETQRYLHGVAVKSRGSGSPKRWQYNYLEEVHERIFTEGVLP